MEIDKDHKFYGAALLQIAEYPQFTAINAYKPSGKSARCSFIINADIGIYLRYRSEPDPTRHSEYSFHFNQSNLYELEELDKRFERVFIAFICGEAKGICCIPYAILLDLIVDRLDAKDEVEDTYTVLVTAHTGQSFRVYVNNPGKRNETTGKKYTFTRTSFPKCLFVG